MAVRQLNRKELLTDVNNGMKLPELAAKYEVPKLALSKALKHAGITLKRASKATQIMIIDTESIDTTPTPEAVELLSLTPVIDEQS